MNEIMITVNFDDEKPTVSGRELHEALMVTTPYHKWFPRMCEYGFTEGRDFNLDKNVRVQNEGCRSVARELIDHRITINMAKELCMIQRTEIGKRCREYFLEIERKWNSPDAILARALLIANHQLQLIKCENTKLLEENTEQAEKIKGMLPKASYYDYVLNAEGLMPISTIAKDYGKSAIWLNKWLKEYPDIVGVQEICKMLGIGETKAYRMINDGTLRRIPCSRTHKVAKITVIDYVLQCAQK